MSDVAVPTQEALPGGREAQPAGTWKVGSLHPTAVKVLTVLGFAIPVGAYLAMLAHYQVNVPLTDEWGQVHAVVARNYSRLDLSSLWALHTDNRMLFPNLVVVGLAHTVSLNIEVEEWLQRADAVRLDGATHLGSQAPLTQHAPALLRPRRLRHAHLCAISEQPVGVPDGLVPSPARVRSERGPTGPTRPDVADPRRSCTGGRRGQLFLGTGPTHLASWPCASLSPTTVALGLHQLDRCRPRHHRAVLLQLPGLLGQFFLRRHAPGVVRQALSLRIG